MLLSTHTQCATAEGRRRKAVKLCAESVKTVKRLAGRQWRDVGQGDSPTSIYELPELYEAFQKSTRLTEIAISFARPTHSFGLCSSKKETLDKLLLQAKCGGWQQHRKNSYKIL